MSDQSKHIEPIGNRYMLTQEKLVSKAGILVEDDAISRRPVGTVVSIGSEVAKSDIAVGDQVCFNELAGERIALEHNEYLLVNRSDILAVIKLNA
jgi:co-chaperonin GroES (HSP10)